ncbi:unnamed protein product [Clonostachys chloroleuca]|uniref:Kelch repeat protein n=1 Tax=Clonostachys chloroleuca TaxID=1926264 RepID=A0AA35Q130_9HYPO|nr:unnamed protein product [Clonostachys chloroleuca]
MKVAVQSLLAALAGTAVAQFGGWKEGQVNTSICTWEQLRGALVRDMIYLDGGDLNWIPGMNNGMFGNVLNDGNVRGPILTFNLSKSFTADTNVTQILTDNYISKARGGTGNALGAAPNFVDGGMLYNDAEFWMFGGNLFQNKRLYDNPDEHWALGFQAYQYGPDKPLWGPGFVDAKLGNVSRYITYGGAVSAPSENLAWYFPGMTSPSEGELTTVAYPNGSTTAQNVSTSMVTLDMATQSSEKWAYKTLPTSVKGRANPEVVWVPVGEQGILVVLGGVTYPEWAGVTTSRKSENETASKSESPKFMQEIDVYDIKNDKWYKQSTQNGPGATTRGCAVVAPASDYSSYNIYYYGGYDGINPKQPYYDQVWVLSIPSFTWTKVNEGTDLHARTGHKCFKPYPDQMMVIGGITSQAGNTISCLDGGPVVMFNLTSASWMTSYDPSVHGDYGVPDKVVEAIGGSPTGGATLTSPSPSGWANKDLGKVFDTPYDKKKIKTYYPYAAAATQTTRPTLTPDSGNSKGGSGLPSWVAPVLGVVLGLIFLTGVIVVFCLYRRRKLLKSGSSESGTEDAGNRIISWMKGQHVTEKAVTVTTSDDIPVYSTTKSPEMGELRNNGPLPPPPPSVSASATVPTSSPEPTQFSEMGGNPIAELGDTSPPAELGDNPLSAAAAARSNSSSGPSELYSSSPRSSVAGFVDAHSRAESPESPAIPVSPEQFGDRQGMRSIPEELARFGPVEKDDDRPAVGRTESEQTQLSPISPPTAGDVVGQDYISARPTGSPGQTRPSVFREHEEDLGDRR